MTDYQRARTGTIPSQTEAARQMGRRLTEHASSATFIASQVLPVLTDSARIDRGRAPARLAPPAVHRTKFLPTKAEAIANPHPDYRVLRSAGLAVNEKLDVWMMTRFEHVHTAARTPDVFSSAQGIFLRSVDVPVMITRDRPDHGRIRRVTASHFTPNRMALLESDVARLAQPVITRLARGESVDFADLAVPLPMTIIAHLLGVPEHKWRAFRSWSNNLAKVFAPEDMWGLLKLVRNSITSVVRLEALTQREVADRRSHPRDDLFTALSQAVDSGDLDRFEALLYVIILVVAGNETTSNLLGMLADVLARDPELYERVRDDRQLVPKLVDETLRWGSPVQWVGRCTTEPYVVDDVEIPANSRVLLHYAAANRDPQRYSDPDRIDLDRKVGGSVAFGTGPHMCLGNHLAKLEAVTVVNMMLNEVPKLQLSGPVLWGKTPSLQGPTSVPVRRTN
ncbi:cytochrome P450 [Mycobacteroides stephanolepidis]|uniref:Cytochrome P450 n=1 Tax=[Mycobacterium] stephanolepidis TaxID=1520670 RepID=A0A1Z4EV73_9MYCO|nr:cytochrome P450 [[Mycobacterium] stephanolepidis]BAX96847.1 cytochrome P450 [[Mycobacterium] stephanolepidis]